MIQLLAGDCRDELATWPPSIINACVTDPPYHLTNNMGTRSPYPGQYTPIGHPKEPRGGFMGKQWDGGSVAFDPDTWGAVLRVLKPGAHMLCFGGTRTHHRLACAIEDAGFEIRDTICWLYGSGFPKSLNCGEGRGTALKPAHEPIIVARKPLIGTVAANVLAYGTGALNIDACRVEGPMDGVWGTSNATVNRERMFNRSPDMDVYRTASHPQGRWPANVIHDGSDEVEAAFGAFGERTSGVMKAGTHLIGQRNTFGNDAAAGYKTRQDTYGDTGCASRFFYSAKADAADRADSRHPTVKPVDLIRYLVQLITPPGGHILDPFAGSGTTGEAAMLLGHDCTLIEQDAQHVADIEHRRKRWSGGDLPLFTSFPPASDDAYDRGMRDLFRDAAD